MWIVFLLVNHNRLMLSSKDGLVLAWEGCIYLMVNHKTSISIRSSHLRSIVWAPRTVILPSRFCTPRKGCMGIIHLRKRVSSKLHWSVQTEIVAHAWHSTSWGVRPLFKRYVSINSSLDVSGWPPNVQEGSFAGRARGWDTRRRSLQQPNTHGPWSSTWQCKWQQKQP